MENKLQEASNRNAHPWSGYAVTVVESTTDAVIVVDRTWRVVFMNGHARTIIGKRDMLGRNFWEGLPRPAGGVFEEAARKAMGERTPVRCDDFYEPMGKWFENSIYPCQEGIVIYFRDITEAKRLELAQREKEGTIRRQLVELGDVYTSAPIGLALIGPDLRFLRVNQQIADINRVPAAAHVGKAIGEILPDFAEFFEPIARRVLETGEPVFDIEVEGEAPNEPGTRRMYREQWLPQKDATGKVVAINIVVSDVTNEKRIERELRDKVEELQALLDAVPAAVFVAHDRECRTMYGNRTTEQTLRLPYYANPSKSAGHTAPRNFTVFKDGVELSPEDLPIQKAAATGKAVRHFELTLAFDSGDTAYIYGNATPLFDSGGKTRGAVGAFIDITGLVEAREATLRRDAELERLVEERTRDLFEANARLSRQIAEREEAEQVSAQHKQNAIGLVASGVAHDINKLLQVIGTSLEKIELQPSDQSVGHHLMTAQGALQRAAGLTHRLRELAQNQQLAPTVIDANKHVHSVCDILRQTIGAEIRIKQVLAPDLWPIMVDSNQFDLALLHLAANSRDAMPGGGLLILTTTNYAANDATLPGQIAGRDCVCIAVCDTGRGMSEEVLARALEPFFDETEGSCVGLGLSIIAGFARKSGGALRISSSLGLGTVAEIFLPKAVETQTTAED